MSFGIDPPVRWRRFRARALASARLLSQLNLKLNVWLLTGQVIMALHEKKVPFSCREIQITRGEQYEPWYLQINPKGEVPVLQDGVRVIPDSSRIIDYLEDNFSNGMYVTDKPACPLPCSVHVRREQAASRP